MRTYLKEELEQFLRAVDAVLERRVEVILSRDWGTLK
jgi:type III secretory pathway lipoprotein EscJ